MMRYVIFALSLLFSFNVLAGECGIGFRTAVISDNQRDLGYCEVITEGVPVRYDLANPKGGESILFGGRLPTPEGDVLLSDVICYDVNGWKSLPAELECIKPSTPNILTFTIKLGPE